MNKFGLERALSNERQGTDDLAGKSLGNAGRCENIGPNKLSQAGKAVANVRRRLMHAGYSENSSNDNDSIPFETAFA